MWEIEVTDEFTVWYSSLSEDDQERVRAAMVYLERYGPGLARPWADLVKGSRHRNMKELCPRGGFLRVFFCFDPRRTCILLIGGNKRGIWREFYAQLIPIADALYDVYLAELREEGLLNGS